MAAWYLSFCVLISFGKNTSPIGAEPYRPHFNVITSFRALSPNAVTFWVLGARASPLLFSRSLSRLSGWRRPTSSSPLSHPQLVLTVGLLAVVVYLYTVVAFNFFRKFYNKSEDDEEPDMKCDDMMTVRPRGAPGPRPGWERRALEQNRDESRM